MPSMIHRRMLLRMTELISVMLASTLMASPSATATESASRTVRGDVMAVNVSASPQVIVVKTMTPAHEELVVGAAVNSGTIITRRKQPAHLNDLRVGEPVTITYLKGKDGLIAQSIQAQ